VNTCASERGLVAAGPRLQQLRLARGQLDCVRRRLDQPLDGRAHVLDPAQKARLAHEAVVHRDVEAAARAGVEQAIEPVGGHARNEPYGSGDIAVKPGGSCRDDRAP
jgi:hypothetical protein